MSEALADGVTTRLGELVAAMRAEGSRVGVGELLSAHRALVAVLGLRPEPIGARRLPGVLPKAIGAGRLREDARLALRAVLCSRHEDLPRFELAFLAVFGDGRDPGAEAPLEELGAVARSALPRAGVPDPAPPGPREDGVREPEPVPAAYSELELLHDKDFALYSEAEFALAHELIVRLARRAPLRRSRRRRRANGRGETLDLRRIVRSSLACGGEPVRRHWRSPSLRPRPVVLVCDVSGSMSPYARMLLQYLHACVAARRRVEAFAFGTRLTRVTNELAGRDHDRALRRATAAVLDFSGGTRIGAALAELNRAHGRRLGGGAIVVILSDGWDRGEPAVLAAEMARLRRSAHRLVWLNPLAADPRFAPLARGMQAAVPYTDRLLAGNSLRSLGALADTLEDL